MGFASWQHYCTSSSSGRQPNFAALNRGRHVHSAGRPSRWALAHILVVHSMGMWPNKLPIFNCIMLSSITSTISPIHEYVSVLLRQLQKLLTRWSNIGKLDKTCNKLVITLVSSCGRFPVLWTNDWQAYLTFLINVWMIDLCLERNLWRLERILGWKIYPHTECTLVVWRTLLHAVYTTNK